MLEDAPINVASRARSGIAAAAVWRPLLGEVQQEAHGVTVGGDRVGTRRGLTARRSVK